MRALQALTLIALTGCASYKTQPVERWASMPTPQTWNTGQPWSVVVLDQKRHTIGSMILRFTDQRADATDACVSGDWKKIEVLSQHFAPGQSFGGENNLVYSLHGRALEVGAYQICDAYSTLIGELTDRMATGLYTTQSMFDHHTVGSFAAHPVSGDGR
jgi:hypothetical protein